MNYYVKNYISNSNVFVSIADTIEKVLKKMDEFKVDRITVIDKNDFVSAIISKEDIERATRFGIKNLLQKPVESILQLSKYSIIAYPQNNIDEAFSIMKNMKMKYLPVVKSPWEKKLIGFVSMEELQNTKWNKI